MADQLNAFMVGWTRDWAAEEQTRSAPVLAPRPTYCFRCIQTGQRPSAMIVLTQSGAGTFVVANILPLSKHQLPTREYNTVLEDFYEQLIRSYTETHGITAKLSNDRVDLEHWMSPDTAELLRSFSACANQGTGGHPRWQTNSLSSTNTAGSYSLTQTDKCVFCTSNTKDYGTPHASLANDLAAVQLTFTTKLPWALHEIRN